jgi:uncharacterized membrane protein YsdA (DUF1294 family)
MDPPSLPPAVIVYLGLNILAGIAFAGDKFRAKVNIRRTPENALVFLAALGPFGSLAAMAGLRHKTRQGTFLLVPVFAILHLVLILWLWTWITYDL